MIIGIQKISLGKEFILPFFIVFGSNTLMFAIFVHLLDYLYGRLLLLQGLLLLQL